MIKQEPEWVRDFRLKSLEAFHELEMPDFGPKIKINFNKINYYKKATEKIAENWDLLFPERRLGGELTRALGYPGAVSKGHGLPSSAELTWHSTPPRLQQVGPGNYTPFLPGVALPFMSHL